MVELKIPGGISCFAVNINGERYNTMLSSIMNRTPVNDEMWDNVRLCSALRAMNSNKLRVCDRISRVYG